MTLIVRRDSHRIDAYAGDQLAAWAIHDNYGWALMARIKTPRGNAVLTIDRVDPLAHINPAQDRSMAKALLRRFVDTGTTGEGMWAHIASHSPWAVAR